MSEETPATEAAPAPKPRKKRLLLSLAAGFLVLAVLGGSYWYFTQKRLPNYHVVSPGRLYRSGQPRGIGLKVLRLKGIKTSINLRKPDSNGVQAERDYFTQNGVNFHMIPVGHTGEDLDESVAKFLAICDDEANLPVLVHCSRGKERAGFFSAIYRMEYDHWRNQQALVEMYDLGFGPGDMPLIENYIWNYTPRWKKDDPKSNKKNAPNWQE